MLSFSSLFSISLGFNFGLGERDVGSKRDVTCLEDRNGTNRPEGLKLDG